MCNERAWPQQCWKSCANGSNIVALRFGDHGTKEMLGVVGWKVWPVSNFAQQHATTSNNMQQGVQTDATCNIQQCCVRLHGAYQIDFIIMRHFHAMFIQANSNLLGYMTLRKPRWQLMRNLSLNIYLLVFRPAIFSRCRRFFVCLFVCFFFFQYFLFYVETSG